MSAFFISRRKQALLLVEGCSGYNDQSRNRRIQIAKMIRDLRSDLIFSPTQPDSYDLSLLLESLTDEEHDEVFEAFLNA